MTLHLTHISPSFALQVSDRLVRGGVAVPLANKNILYSARDSFVSMGYTGLAYGLASDPDIPTDEWIAQILWRKPIPRGPDGVSPVAFGLASISGRMDLRLSLQVIRDELQNAINRLPSDRRDLSFELIVSGWRQGRRASAQP